MPDETLDTAQRFRQRENLGAFDEATRKGDVAQLDADHPAESLHLSSRELVLGMGAQAGVIHALDSGMFLQPVGDPTTARIMLAHSQRPRLRTAQRQQAVEWTGDRASGVLNEA